MSKAVVTIHQPSITEWFASIGDPTTAELLRIEDNRKADRLEQLYQTIGLPYERPEIYPARSFFSPDQQIQAVLSERANELCAMRLVPIKPGLPKLRNRGLTIHDCYTTWLTSLTINPDDYELHLCPHSNTLLWSMIFVVNEDGVFGEIVAGLHSQLTQGSTENRPIQFRFDFTAWQWSEINTEAQTIAKKALAFLQTDSSKQEELTRSLEARFSHNYLVGYFETTIWPGSIMNFIDYNRILVDHIQDFAIFSEKEPSEKLTRGMSAYPGTVQGKARIVTDTSLTDVDFQNGDILICDNTDIRYLPLMQRAGAIVTNRGGILSHAAIIARELHKPCIVGAKSATDAFSDGQILEVNAETGTVTILKANHAHT